MLQLTFANCLTGKNAKWTRAGFYLARALLVIALALTLALAQP